jgi:molybdenum cofactor cytidylyltransferase
VNSGVLLLAAGRATRFGADKRLARLPDGRTVIDTTLANIQRSGLPILVCLGAEDEALAQHLRQRDINCQCCPRALEGMGGTLAEGVGLIPDWECVLIALADMPWIMPGTYSAIAERLTTENIVVPVNGGRRGHPVGFGCDFYTELTALNGETGARGLLYRHAVRITEVPVADAAIHRDIDVPADLRAVLQEPDA